MRHWIDLCENYTPRDHEEFFHASLNHLPVGTVLEYRGTSGMDMEVEEILERYRPSHCRSRKSVYVVNDIRALDTVLAQYDFLYVVEPEGELERYDAVWLNRIWQAMAAEDNGDAEFTDEMKRTLALNYWSGKPCPLQVGEELAWEFLCQSAIIVEEIEE